MSVADATPDTNNSGQRMPHNISTERFGSCRFFYLLYRLRNNRLFDRFSGLNRCGLMLISPHGERAAALRRTLALQRSVGLMAEEIDADEAQRIHPLLAIDDDPVIGWEPGAGYADAYMTLSSFARAARRRGAALREGVAGNER